MAVTPQQPKEFEEKVIAIDRVARVVKGGRRFRFRATVVIGDGKGRVGVGVGKGGEVMTSIAKAVSRAKSHMPGHVYYLSQLRLVPELSPAAPFATLLKQPVSTTCSQSRLVPPIRLITPMQQCWPCLN
jgi:hypothetical protein